MKEVKLPNDPFYNGFALIISGLILYAVYYFFKTETASALIWAGGLLFFALCCYIGPKGEMVWEWLMWIVLLLCFAIWELAAA